METPIYSAPPVIAQPRGNDKIWSMLSHLSSFIGLPFLLPLVVYLAMRDDSPYARANARESTPSQSRRCVWEARLSRRVCRPRRVLCTTIAPHAPKNSPTPTSP